MRIHKAGYGSILIVVMTVAVCLVVLFTYVANWWVLGGAVLVSLLVLLQIFTFFRVPKRNILLDEEGIVAPADGKVVIVEEVVSREFLQEKCLQISIFMSLFNVHVNWYPMGGKIVYYKYHEGDKMVAWHPKSSEKNEHTTLFIQQGDTTIGVRQIAGLVARRIVSYAQPTKEIQQCSELGIIKFGSRVDILLPLTAKICVKVGDKVRGSQTLLAKLN